MSMKAAGYKCPFCGYDDGEFDIIEFRVEDGVPVAIDLECPECFYQWQEIDGE